MTTSLTPTRGKLSLPHALIVFVTLGILNGLGNAKAPAQIINLSSNQTINDLSGVGTVDLNGFKLTADNSVDTAFAGTINGLNSSGLEKTGAAFLDLSNATLALSTNADDMNAITVSGGTLSFGAMATETRGNNATALHATGNGNTLEIASAILVTGGAGAHGAVADAAAEIKLGDNTHVTTQGSGAYALYANGAGSRISGSNINITTTGGFDMNTYRASDAVEAIHGANVNLTGGTLRTFGEWAAGLVAGYDSNDKDAVITASNLHITTNEQTAWGAMVYGGTLSFSDGEIITNGTNGVGLYAAYEGTLNVENSTVTTNNYFGTAVALELGGTMAATGITITTHGDFADGISIAHTTTQIDFNGTANRITTTGSIAHGFSVYEGGTKTFDQNTGNALPNITVNGSESALLYAEGAGSGITLGGNTALTLDMTGHSTETYGVKVKDTADVTLTDTAESGGTRLRATDSGTLRFTGSSDAAGSRVMLDNTSVLDLSAIASGTLRIGSLEGDTTSTVSLGANKLDIGATNATGEGTLLTSSTYAGTINGTNGGLVKQGTGTLALTGSNTYNGGTTLREGTLIAANATAAALALGTGEIRYDNNATNAEARLLFITTATLTQRENVTASSHGTLEAATGATLTITATATPAISGGAVMVNTGGTYSVIGNINYTGNKATSTGGAIQTTGGELNAAHITFENNTAAYGGAISAQSNATANLSGALFTTNTAARTGGAIFAENFALDVSTGTFTGNHALWGGAIGAQNTTVNANDTLLTSNTSTLSGGAISLAHGGTFNALNATITNNTSINGVGGAIDAYADTASLTINLGATAGCTSTISGNTDIYGSNGINLCGENAAYTLTLNIAVAADGLLAMLDPMRTETGADRFAFHAAKTGAGEWQLSGTNTIAGTGGNTVTVQEGIFTLLANSVINLTHTATDAMTITTGGTLSTLADSQVQTSNYNQQSGGALHVTLGATQQPAILATTATLGSGATLAITNLTEAGPFAKASDLPANIYTLIHTTGGITGDYAPANVLINGGTLTNPHNYITLGAHKTADTLDYNLGYQLTWFTGTTTAHGTFTLAASSTFNIDIGLADQTALGAFATGWEGKTLVKDGAGTLILSATNTHTGITQLLNGLTRTDTDHALGNNAALTLASPATLDLNAHTQTIGALNTALGSTLKINNGSLNLTNGGTSSGMLTGSGTLNLIGGTLVIIGANPTLTANTNLATTATARLTDTGGLGTTGTLTLAQNSALVIDIATNGTLSNPLTGNGALIKTGNATATIATANTAYTGTTIVQNGTLSATNLAAVGATPIITNAGGTFELRNIATGTFGNTVSGNGALMLTTSTLSLTGNNSMAAANLARSTVTLRTNNALGTANTAITLDNASTIWIATAAAQLGTVNLNGGRLGFAPTGTTPAVYRTANIAALGNTGGTLIFNVDFNNATGLVAPGTKADYMRIAKDGTATHQVHLNATGVSDTAATTIEIIDAGTATATYRLDTANGKYDSGMTTYELKKGDTTALLRKTQSWYLTNTGLSNAADAIINTASMLGTDWFYNLDSLHQRMGDVRSENLPVKPSELENALAANDGNIWTRARAYRINATNQLSGNAFTQYGYGVTAGLDKAFGCTNATMLLGAMIDMGNIDRDFVNNSDGHTQTLSAGLYATWLHKDGWYADLVAKADRYKNRFDARTTDNVTVGGSYTSQTQGLSLELGRRLMQANGWWVEPALQASVVFIDSAHYTTTPSDRVIYVTLPSATDVQYRGMVRFGRQLCETNWNPYGKFAIVRVDTHNGGIEANGKTYTPDYSGWRAEAGFGTAYQLGNNSQVYVDYEYAKAEYYERPWSLNLGIRCVW